MVKYYDPQIYGDCQIGEVDEYDGRIYVCSSDYSALERRVAELERDAARYRWLRDNCQEAADNYATSGQLYFGTYGYGGLDAEIDAKIEDSRNDKG